MTAAVSRTFPALSRLRANLAFATKRIVPLCWTPGMRHSTDGFNPSSEFKTQARTNSRSFLQARGTGTQTLSSSDAETLLRNRRILVAGTPPTREKWKRWGGVPVILMPHFCRLVEAEKGIAHGANSRHAHE